MWDPAGTGDSFATRHGSVNLRLKLKRNFPSHPGRAGHSVSRVLVLCVEATACGTQDGTWEHDRTRRLVDRAWERTVQCSLFLHIGFKFMAQHGRDVAG